MKTQKDSTWSRVKSFLSMNFSTSSKEDIDRQLYPILQDAINLGINQDFYSDRPILEELGKWFQFVMAQNNQNAQSNQNAHINHNSVIL